MGARVRARQAWCRSKRVRQATAAAVLHIATLGLTSCQHDKVHTRLDDELAALQKSASLREPTTVVSGVGDVYWAAPSPDGREVLYVSAESGNLDIWSRDLDTLVTQRLTENPADDSEPTFSPDGERIAFVSRRDDAKGDIWIMNRDGSDQTRLTGAIAAERSPVFAPDSKSLYIALRPAADALENVYQLDLASRTPRAVTSDGGFDPAIDPSGRFLSYSKPFIATESAGSSGGPSTRIEVRRLSDGKVLLATDGRRPEAFSRFATDGAGVLWLYFGRYVEDDNRDGRIDTFDTPCIYRVPVDDAAFSDSTLRYAEPITSGGNAENIPVAQGDRLFFVAQGAEHLEIQALPLDGLLPANTPTEAVMALADGDLSPRLRRYALRVVMGRPGPESIRARYELARDFAAEGKIADAQGAFDRLIELAGPQTPLGRLARLEKIRNQAVLEASAGQEAEDKAKAAIAAVEQESDSEVIRSRAAVVNAELSELFGQYEPALAHAGAVRGKDAAYDEDATRAAAVNARLAALSLPLEEQAMRLLLIMQEHPNQVRERRTALDRLTELLPKAAPERVALLEKLLQHAKAPALRSPLLRRYADTLLLQGEAQTAVSVLTQALSSQDFSTIDQARMQLSLATALETAGEPGKAIEALERVVRATTVPRQQRDRARSELLRIALAKARRDEQRGDTKGAYDAYRTLYDNNPQEAAAVRKVVTLGNALGLSQAVEAEMKDRANKNRYDKVAVYGHALAASFVGDLGTTRKKVDAALALDRRFAWARMLLGWLYEREGHRTAYLDAADQYDKALAKFERDKDEEGIADASLNLGNALFGAGQIDQAFELYVQREHSRILFQNRGQELVFLERFGQTAIRAGAYDVALTELRDAVRLAVSEGDERRLGRLRGLIAMAYSQLDMPEQARAQMLLARDDYAARGDLDRVVVLDRALAVLFLAAGEDAESARALERAERLRLEGHGPKGYAFGALSILLPLTPTDTSRAPYGFSKTDEDEIIATLYGRLYRRLVDLQRAEQFMQERIKLLERLAGDDVMNPIVVRERLAAHSELMLLRERAGDRQQADVLAEQALASLEKAPAERTSLAWAEPILVVLEDRPRARQAELVARLRSLASTADKRLPEEDPSASAVKARLLALANRQPSLLPEQPAPAAIEAMVSSLDAALGQLDKPLDQASSAPASESSSAPAAAAPAGPVMLTRRVGARVARDLINQSEAAWLRGQIADGERLANEADALIKELSLFEADWQLAYLRYRLGPVEARDEALQSAGRKLRVADLASRLLYPARPRPALRDGLLNALIADSVTQRSAIRAVQWVEQRDTVKTFVLPTALSAPNDPSVSKARDKLAEWRRSTLRHLEEERAGTNSRALPRLRDAFGELAKTLETLPHPLSILASGTVDVAALQKRLGANDILRVATLANRPDIIITANDLRFSDNDTAGSQPTTQPASAPSSLPSSTWTYATRDGADGINAFAASVGTLALQLEARSVASELGIEIGAGPALVPDAARPTLTTELAGARRKVARISSAFVRAASPSTFAFALTEKAGFDSLAYAADLPRAFAPADVVLVDGEPLSAEQKRLIVRALAVTGSPTTLFCPASPQAEADKLTKRVLQSLDSGTTPSGCEIYGPPPPNAEQQQAIAKARLKQLDDAAAKAKQQQRYTDAIKIFEEALDLASFLKNEDTKLAYRAELATLCGRLRRFEDAIDYQRDVIAAYEARDAKKTAAAAWSLLGQIYSIAQRPGDSVAAFEKAIVLYRELKLDLDTAKTLTSQGTAYRAAVRYEEARKAYLAAADLYRGLKLPAEETNALRFAAIIADQNFSDFAPALELYQRALVTAEQSGNASLILRSRIDIARTQRKLSRFSESLAAFRSILRELGKAPIDVTSLASRFEAQIELARVYWLRGNFERGLQETQQSLALAEAARSLAKEKADISRAERLRLQAISLEGLILTSQSKLIAGTNRFRRALRLARSRNDRFEEAAQLNNLGFVLRERGLAEAQQVFEQALLIDTELKDNDGLAFDFRNLGTTHLRAGRLEESRQTLNRADELNRKIGNRQNDLQIRLAKAELLLLEKNKPAALAAFVETARLATELNFSDTVWRAELGRALCTTSLAEREKILEGAFAAWIRLSVPLDESNAAQSPFNPLSSAHLVQALLEHYLERARLEDREQVLERLERAMETLRLKELREATPVAAWLKRTGIDPDDFSNDRRVAEAASKDPLLAPLLLLNPSRTLKDLPAGSYVMLRAISNGIVWLTAGPSGKKAGLAAIPWAELQQQAARWNDAVRWMAKPEPLALFKLLSDIIQEALPPANTAGPAPSLVLFADPFLSRLPYAALPFGTTGSSYLIEHAAVVMSLSISHRQTIAPIGAVDELSVVMPKPSDGLPYAELEAKESLALWKEQGRRASVRAVSDLPNVTKGAVHLALHANSEGAGFERALLRQGNDTLAASRLVEVRNDLSTVVLSACQDGGETLRGGELVTAFQLAGAKRVIAPFGRIHDDIAAAFSKRLLRVLLRGGGPHEFAGLQLEKARQKEPPAVWASYQYWE